MYKHVLWQILLLLLLLFRHILATLHFNENVHRKPKKKDGKTYQCVTYPKFKLGDEVVWEVAVPPAYGEFKLVITTEELERKLPFTVCCTLIALNYSYYFTVQGYVGNIKEILFSKPDKELIAIKEKYAKKVPQPLNSQFPDRKLKDEAIKQQRKRRHKEAENRDYFMVGECVRFVFMSCEGSLNERVSAANNKNHTNKPTMK